MDGQRVPAWKRLGLKLKPADPQAESLNAPTAAPRSSAPVQRNDFDSPKRKRQPFGDSQAAKPSLKKPRTDDRQFDTPLRRQKSVSFAEGADSGKSAAQEPRKAKSGPKKKKGPKNQPQTPAAPPDLTVALDYLRRWKTSRDTWKFNKNHQTHLINNVFDPSLVPAADVDIFYEYIRDLKGHIRTRLSESARKVCAEDMDEEKSHFPAGTTDLESKKRQYEEIMSNFLRRSQSSSKRKHFNEAEFATSKDADPEVARRVAKRMRAEIVAEELGTESDASETTASSNTAAASEEPARKEASEEPEVDKRAKLNDGRPVKRVRASKRRGADLDDSSSESSDSDSDSDSDDSSDDDSESGSVSDSESSDSSDDSDDEMADAGANGQDTSSSSSSSSDEDDSNDNGR